jgi:hypothetical protein
VVLGHTHHPEGIWEDGVFYGNSGTWSAAFKDLECTQPIADERPVVWLRSEGGQMSGGLVLWRRGGFVEPKAPETTPHRPVSMNPAVSSA